ncbi:MAG TPA: dTDP-4-amino-4,6-dideoxygalactose transaminase [Bryobacteraceae bacterium]|nr:dTDP-4-amino-4,6-dideoxygalactose transaminase [Bryobacteraceae bacterium]
MKDPERLAVPFNRPSLIGTEQFYLQESIASGHISGDGPFTDLCNEELAAALGAKKVLLTTSCTHALEMSALLLDIGPGDEVLVPSFTFVSTANAFCLFGATPIFVDIRPDTLNVDESTIAAKITPRTKAIVCMHYAGVGCEMDYITRIASRSGVSVIEDNAHGLFGRYRGKSLGTFGQMATQSFHETKNMSCGEGGALVINDETLIERAEVIREKGTNRRRFFQGLIDKYSWVDFGSSYLPSDLLAAYLYAQLKARAQIQAARAKIWLRYTSELQEWCSQNNVGLPFVPGHCEQPYHLFYLIMPSEGIRNEFIAYMKQKGVMTPFHYLPLHLSPMGSRFGAKNGDCPISEQVSVRLVRLPIYNSMSCVEQDAVIQAIRSFKIRQAECKQQRDSIHINAEG